jgi:hypothetical protein
MFGSTIEPQVLDSSVIKEDLHDVHQLGELRENQDLVASLNKFW